MTQLLHPFTRECMAYDDPDRFYFDGEVRERTEDDQGDWLIDALVPIGAMVIYSDPGAGKSMLVQQITHHLAYGVALGPWGTECAGGHLVRVFDLEGWWRQTQQRSYSITPYGQLPGDGDPDRQDNMIAYSTSVIPPVDRPAWQEIGSQAARHTQYLRVMLREADAAAQPIRCVVIDTLTKFVGPRPRTAAGNAYEYEAQVIDALNRLGLEYRCAVILIHHTNKAGELSGSQGIGGSATVTARLRLEERTEDDLVQGVPATGVLVSTKVRHSDPFCYALEQRAVDGVWEFLDRPATEAEARGNARSVLSALRAGPLTKGELSSATGLSGSLAKTLTRMRRQGLIHSRYGRWYRVEGDGRRTVPGQADGRCCECGGPMTVVEQGQQRHPGCEPAPGPAPGPAPDGEERSRRSAMTRMLDSIKRSRMKPMVRVRGADRESEPWALVREDMTGEHRWVLPVGEVEVLDEHASVVVLDRRGSYPAACGSVPLVANTLRHTGPLEVVDKSMGGLFLIPRPEWSDDRIGHPLGRLADRRPPEDGSPHLLWVTTPHLRMLARLGEAGVVSAPEVVDSWTGRATSGLLTAFSKEVQADRLSALQAGDPERYAEVKRETSIAIRALWPKQVRSPFWRPDWSVAVRAEAAVRHWMRAYQCLQGGVRVLKIGRVDEVVLLAEGVPGPYEVGDRYGQVSVKWTGTLAGWLDADRQG